MAHPVPNFLLGRRYILCGALAAVALPATATPSLAGVKPDMAKGAMERFKLAKTPKALPDLDIQNADDKPLKLSDFKGKVVLLNFWATWCAPCVKEMPELDAFQRQFAPQGWRVVGLAVDNPTAVREFLARSPFSYTIGLAGFDGSELSRKLGNHQGGLPYTVVFNRQGAIAHRKAGQTSLLELAGWAKSI